MLESFKGRLVNWFVSSWRNASCRNICGFLHLDTIWPEFLKNRSLEVRKDGRWYLYRNIKEMGLEQSSRFIFWNLDIRLIYTPRNVLGNLNEEVRFPVTHFSIWWDDLSLRLHWNTGARVCGESWPALIALSIRVKVERLDMMIPRPKRINVFQRLAVVFRYS